MKPEDYITTIKDTCPDFGEKKGQNIFDHLLYSCAVAREKLGDKFHDNLFLEFGVYTGMTLHWLSRQCNNVIHGFDTFEGLPEDGVGRDGGVVFQKGHFSINYTPVDTPILKFHKGLFQDTLVPFLRENNEKVSVVHIDCDLYSSAKFVLDNIKDRLVSGSVIILDDFCLYSSYEDFIWKAWVEFTAKNSDIKWKFISSAGINQVNGWATVSVLIE